MRIAVAIWIVVLLGTGALLAALGGCVDAAPAAGVSRFTVIETDKDGRWELLRDLKTGRIYFHGKYPNGAFSEVSQERLLCKHLPNGPMVLWNEKTQDFTAEK